ncbi:hypothetical protein [Kordiimonas gwangyangensis]|uniref:hypothetical protein n=1 Tax=Kordiimonas gwangyangensis TaxID=288022 RepID=UPI00035EDCAA|nr:hypothetical protein [Kordiimonas gwangyangensis]
MMAEDKKVTSEIDEKKLSSPGSKADMERVAEELSAAADQHKGLKRLVLVLGLVLLALFGFVVYAIANRAAESLMELEAPADETPIASAPVLSGIAADDFAIMRPAGSTLVSVSGNARELIFHFRDNTGADHIILVDRQTGTQTPVRVP